MTPAADDGLSHAVTGGSLIGSAAVSTLVGLIGFASPCVLPLVPGYLAYLAGLAPEEENRRRMVVGAGLFVLGLATLMVSEGLLLGRLGAALRDHVAGVSRALGVVTMLLGLAYVGLGGRLQREFRVPRPGAGLLGAPILGFTFALAWTPCVTPTLAAVNTLAYSQAGAARGAFLQLCYCAGLGIPFVALAVGLGWMTRAVGLARRHLRGINVAGGTLLVLMGALLALGQWGHVMDWLRASAGPGPLIDL